MVRVTVKPGICGKEITVAASRIDKTKIGVRITSNCDMVTEMGKSLASVDQTEVFQPAAGSEVYRCAATGGLHAACPVPVAVLKAIEVAAGLALARLVSIDFEESTPE